MKECCIEQELGVLSLQSVYDISKIQYPFLAVPRNRDISSVSGSDLLPETALVEKMKT